MLGGLYGLDKNQKRGMILVQLAPTICAVTSLYILDDAFLALISLQIFAYFTIPYLYIKYLSKEKEVGPYFLNEFRERKKQIQVGTSLFMSAFLLVLLAYLMIYEFRTRVIYLLHIPVSYNPFYLLLFVAVMAFVNPVLEEWYWRVFLAKTYEDSGKNSWMINANYALFHFIVLTRVVHWSIAIGMTTTFFSVGKSFEFIVKKYGFISAVLTHIGVSIAASLALLDIFYLEHEHKDLVQAAQATVQ